jgi:peptidoglycan-associated lipoprotein
MKLFTVNLLIAISMGLLGASAHAQATPANGGLTLDLGATYTIIHSNEGPGQCHCFYMSGGGAELAVKNNRGVSFVTSFSGTQAQNINNIDQNLTLYTVLEGVRYSLKHSGRFSPFGEAGVGFAHTNSNYVIYKDTTVAAAQVGGGLDLRVSRHLSIRPAQIDYLFTSSPNGQNNFQNEIRYGAGFVYHFNPPTR